MCFVSSRNLHAAIILHANFFISQLLLSPSQAYGPWISRTPTERRSDGEAQVILKYIREKLIISLLLFGDSNQCAETYKVKVPQALSQFKESRAVLRAHSPPNGLEKTYSFILLI